MPQLTVEEDLPEDSTSEPFADAEGDEITFGTQTPEQLAEIEALRAEMAAVSGEFHGLDERFRRCCMKIQTANREVATQFLNDFQAFIEQAEQTLGKAD
jgi:hypothetical protein